MYYPLLRAADAPPIRPLFVDSCDPKGPYGAKGLGEIANAPTAAALANAVAHALDIRIRKAPLTPDKVLGALRARSTTPRQRYYLWRRPDRWQAAAVRAAYPMGIRAALDRFGTARTAPRGLTPIRGFERPTTLDAAATAMSHAGARPLAGGTDLLPAIGQGVAAPEEFVDVTSIPVLAENVRLSDGGWQIGAGVRLADLAHHDEDTTPAGVIADAVRRIASPQIREMATLGGNLCQQNRCWFFRNDFPCYKRSGWSHPCYAVQGDHRFYHAVAEAHRCQAVTPSDLATVLTALDATAITRAAGGTRRIPLAEFYRGPGETVLRADELLTAVTVPAEAATRTSGFGKLNAYAGDFAIVSTCVSLRMAGGTVRDARVVMGAVAPTPLRLTGVERALVRSPLDRRSIATIADAWKHRTHPLARNGWKVDAAAGLLQSTLEQCLELRS
ncbi:MAG TPA: FAD binding domain-containing protein, partial [Micromonosporaceae bacterium]